MVMDNEYRGLLQLWAFTGSGCCQPDADTDSWAVWHERRTCKRTEKIYGILQFWSIHRRTDHQRYRLFHGGGTCEWWKRYREGYQCCTYRSDGAGCRYRWYGHAGNPVPDSVWYRVLHGAGWKLFRTDPVLCNLWNFNLRLRILHVYDRL